MTSRPIRATTDGRVYLDLQNLARRTGRPTDELQQMYALEGFLARLTHSAYADHFVLKGGILLAAYNSRRPTRDIDLQGRAVSNDTTAILDLMIEVASHHLDDGLNFDTDTATAHEIRDDDVYAGVRVAITASLAAARLSLHVDVSVGDPVWPEPTMIALPRLLDGEIRLMGYPLTMVHAEKIVTAIQRGQANTRWRDFADIALLARHHDIDGSELITSIQEVATYRREQLAALSATLDGYPSVAQARWQAWRRKHKLGDRLAEDFAMVLHEVTTFADPALTGAAAGRTWISVERRWK